MKTLRVCLSSELPPILERDKDFIYFLYDKLEVFNGQNYYGDPYAIVATYPEQYVQGMLYFCLDDGKAKANIGLELVELAEIENTEQLEILKQCGTTFFVNADKRYLDFKTKTISLPFRNGDYKLTVDLANDLKIDADTVIVFDPETNQFVIRGSIQDYGLVYTRDYVGVETDSIKTTVDNNKISSEVKVSGLYDNIIKNTPYGIYASVNDRVTSTVFEAWSEKFKEYSKDIEEYVEELYVLVERAEEIISSGRLSDMILDSLRAVYPEIDSALANYNIYARKIDQMESEIMRIAVDSNARMNHIEDTMQETISEATNEPWGGMNDDDEEESEFGEI